MKPMVGDTYQVQEADYCYGTGTILVMVTALVGEIEYRDEAWWRVKARVADGTVTNHGGWRVRDSIDVRAANLYLARVTLPPAVPEDLTLGYSIMRELARSGATLVEIAPGVWRQSMTDDVRED